MASTMEDSDLLALRSEVLASLKTPAVSPSSKIEEEDEDLEALRQAALLSIRSAPKQNQANLASTNRGQNHYPFKCKFYGNHRARGGNHVMRNYKRSNLIVISTDDVSDNTTKPVVKNPTFFNSNNMKFSVLSEESSSPKTNFSRSKGSGRFSRFESDSNSPESDSDSDFNKDESEYFTYSDERESIRNGKSPNTEVDSTVQERSGPTDSALNGTSKDQLDVRLPHYEQVQKELEKEKTDELQQFPETEATFVTPFKEHKISNYNNLSKTNDISTKQEDIVSSKKPAKTENLCKKTLCTISCSSINKDSVACSSNCNDRETSKTKSNCQKNITKENNANKISLKNECEKEKFHDKGVSEKIDFAKKAFSYSHKGEKREIILIKPGKGDQDKSDKHHLKWDLRMHLTNSGCKDSLHHMSHSSLSSSSSSSETETSSSSSNSSRTCSHDGSSSRSSQSRSPIPVLKSVVGEIKQDRMCENLSLISNLRREKSLRKESKTSRHSSSSRGLQNSDRKKTFLLSPGKEKSSNKSRKSELTPKLPTQSDIAAKYAHGYNRRISHLSPTTDQKNVEERIKNIKNNSSENLSLDTVLSLTELSSKFKNQNRHHCKDFARVHSKKRNLEENLDNKSKSSAKHQEPVVSTEEFSKRLPIHLRLGSGATTYTHKHEKRNSHLLQIGDEKETEERTRDTKYTSHENSTFDVSSSFIECSSKFNSQNRHYKRDSARKHSRKRSSEESPDSRGKRPRYSRKRHESGIRNKKESKLDMKIHRTKSIIQQY